MTKFIEFSLALCLPIAFLARLAGDCGLTYWHFVNLNRFFQKKKKNCCEGLIYPLKHKC